MLTQMLINAGKQAMYCRNHDGENSTAHREALDKIEEITRHIKLQNPEKFWDDDDPEYRKLTSKWAADRAVRKAKRAD